MAWTLAAKVSALDQREVVAAECGGRRLAIYRLGGAYFATSDACPHQGGSLSDGCVVDGFIECPAHFALFDIRTGATDGSVTAASVRTFQTRVEHGEIHVDLDV